MRNKYSMPSSKLQPARKAWKSLSAKVHALNLPRAIATLKTVATRGLNAAIRSLLPLKHRLIMFTTNNYNYNYKRGRYNHSSTSFSPSVHNHNHLRPIYIDELYEEKKVAVGVSNNIIHAEKGKAGEAESSRSSNNVDVMRGNYKGKLKVEKGPFDVEEAWRAVVAMSPQLRPVDERADDFISKVREDLKMESQRSIVEFQDMLKRSV